MGFLRETAPEAAAIAAAIATAIELAAAICIAAVAGVGGCVQQPLKLFPCQYDRLVFPLR